MAGNAYILAVPNKKPIELPPKVAKTFVKHMRAYYAEPSAINRDRIAGDAAHLLKPSAAKRPQAAATRHL